MKCFKKLIAILAAPVLAMAVTHHVPSQYPTIQGGINAAVEGDTVLVADGIYTGWDNKELDFGGKDILLMSENGPANCIIDCEYQGRAF